MSVCWTNQPEILKDLFLSSADIIKAQKRERRHGSVYSGQSKEEKGNFLRILKLKLFKSTIEPLLSLSLSLSSSSSSSSSSLGSLSKHDVDDSKNVT